MKTFIFASRNQKEILRDPLSLGFSICLPVFLLVMITFVQNSANVEIFKLENFTPAIILFSYSFLTLFSSMLIAKDRSSQFLIRLFASPLKPVNYILGYALPLLVLAIIQTVLCYGVAITLGLPFTINIIYSLIIMIPVSLLFISIGLLLGGLFSDKQVGGVSSVLINIAAFTSGMWFDFNMMDGAFKSVSYLLPFAHALDATKLILKGSFSELLTPMIWLLTYIIAIGTLSIFAFKKGMSKDL